jgi:hypothetical protein
MPKEQEMILCACGCGTMFPKFDADGRARRYAHGHNLRRPSKQVLVSCACGCGAAFPKFDGYGASRRYLPGHSSRGENHPNWNRGCAHHSAGYILLKRPDHPTADHKGYVPEHRLVIEAHLGRYLFPGECIHHANGDKSDNRLENLRLCGSNAEHKLQHRHLHPDYRLPSEPNLSIACACGCGAVFPKYDRNGKPRAFVAGHNAKTGTSHRTPVSNNCQQKAGKL